MEDLPAERSSTLSVVPSRSETNGDGRMGVRWYRVKHGYTHRGQCHEYQMKRAHPFCPARDNGARTPAKANGGRGS
jgi:hypothetical protein